MRARRVAEEREHEPQGAIGAEEAVELDGDTVESLEDAMREALAAVEEHSGEPGPEGDLPRDGAAPASGLEAQVAELREKWLRALADLENYRKRSQRDRHEELRYRGFEVLRGLVPIVDNLGRALASEGSVADLKQGIEMIRRQLESLLRDHGVERVEALGKPFDPGLHEAVSRHLDPAVTEPTVTLELQPGYRLHDRLLRPASVRVATPASGPANEAGRGEDLA
ncbi:MAG: nucleotide exchange factor GrpE [Thermoanaerobaculia bacterium]